MKDKIVQRVITKLTLRSETGIRKYGVTMDRDDLSFAEWMQHLQEELMDAIIYIEKLKDENNKQHNGVHIEESGSEECTLEAR
jgi:hypothetical protein